MLDWLKQLGFRLRILRVLLREAIGTRRLRREPEVSLVMSEEEEVLAFADAGEQQSSLRAFYIMNAGLTSQVIQGCARVLDLGCGPANQLALLAELNPETEFVGVDLSAGMLERARKTIEAKKLQNVEVQLGDITRLEFPDQSFDGIISTLTLHHLPNIDYLRAAFREIKRLLRPGGKVFLINHGRLKSIASILAISYKDYFWMPYFCNLDSERSLRAAFLPHQFQFLAGEFLPPDVHYFQTFLAPLYMGISSEPRPLGTELRETLVRWSDELLPRYRRDQVDMRKSLALGGLRLDPFVARAPNASSPPPLAKPPPRRARRMFLVVAMMGRMTLLRSRRALSTLRIRLFIRHLQRRQQRMTRSEDAFHERLAVVLRRDLGSLKGPLMKVGQMLGYMAVGLHPALRAVLRSLQDSAHPIPGGQVRAIVERELGSPVESLFEEWWDLPLAAGTVSQVHMARTHDGQQVVVKVQYPNVEKAIEHDIHLLKMARPLLRLVFGLRNLGELLEELRTLLLNECDFQAEARVQEKYRQVFSHDPDVLVPKAYPALTTRQVLTMEYVAGLRYYEFAATAPEALKDKVGAVIWRIAVEAIFKHHLYNADPHPGNYIFVGDKVCFIDFGFTKEFSDAFVDAWRDHTRALMNGNVAEFVEATRRMGLRIRKPGARDAAIRAHEGGRRGLARGRGVRVHQGLGVGADADIEGALSACPRRTRAHRVCRHRPCLVGALRPVGRPEIEGELEAHLGGSLGAGRPRGAAGGGHRPEPLSARPGAEDRRSSAGQGARAQRKPLFW